MSRSSPSSLSRTNSALRNSSAIVVIRLFAALSVASSCCSALSSASSRSIATSRSVAEHPTPPRPLCALLTLYPIGVGLTSTLLLLGHCELRHNGVLGRLGLRGYRKSRLSQSGRDPAGLHSSP